MEPLEKIDLDVCEEFLKQLEQNYKIKKSSALFITWQAYFDIAHGPIPLSIRDVSHWEPDDIPFQDLAHQIDLAIYNSTPAFSLGLCYITFSTTDTCPLGGDCAWRHKKLTAAEERWLTKIGSKRLIDDMVECQREGDGVPVVIEKTRWHC
jgi:hypothetical protein